MRQILFFAFAALVIAGVMPRVMSHVGMRPAVETRQPTEKAEPRQAADRGLPHRDGARRSPRPFPGRRLGRRPPPRLPGRHRRLGRGAARARCQQARHFPRRARLHGRRQHGERRGRGRAGRLPSLEVNGIRVYRRRAPWCCPTRRWGEPARHDVSVARAPLRDGQRPSRDGTLTLLQTLSTVWRLGYVLGARFRAPRGFDAPQTEAVAHAQHLCLRIRADGEAHGLSRIRRALAVRQRNQPDGRAGAGPWARHADPRAWREAGARDGARFPRLFGLDQDGAGHRPDDRRHQGEGHRPRGDADGVFRAVRSRRAVRRDGDGLAQRQRLDRREDGREPPAHLRSRRDDAAEGDRAQRARQGEGGRRLRVHREFPRTLHRGPHQPAEDQAQAEGRVRLRQRHGRRVLAEGAGSDRLRGGPARLRTRSHVPELQSRTPKT